MKFSTEAWIARKHKNYKSDLRDYLIAKNAGTSKDRTQNQVVWWEVKEGDPIIASSVNYWVSKINEEMITRNKFFENNEKFTEQNTIKSQEILYSKTAFGEPYIEAQKILRNFLSDTITSDLPSELKTLKNPDAKVLVLSRRDKFARIPFNHTEESGKNFTITYNQVFDYFGDKRGTSTQQTYYSDLKELERFVKNREEPVNVGVLSQGEIEWFNNISVESIELLEIPVTPDSELGERPQTWTENVGEDKAQIAVENFFQLRGYDSSKPITDSSNKAIVEKHLSTLTTKTDNFGKEYETNDPEERYKKNIEWGHTKRNIKVTIKLKYNENIESFVQQNLNGALITAERFNQFKAYTNKLTSACLCNCNYCTCDCNYCTCDCNYCTCNCNYCTCNCNYCTCNCNYKYLDPNDVNIKVADINYYATTFCACDVNKGQWRGEYGHIHTSCPGNVENYKACTCNLHGNGRNLVNKIFYIASISESCSCNANTKVLDFKTSFFKGVSEFNNTDNSAQPDTVPMFSKAETIQDKITETGKATTKYQVCVCDVNTKLVKETRTFRDSGAILKEVVRGYNLDGSLQIRYVLNREIKDYYYPETYTTKTFNKVTCTANRDMETRIDYKKFWEDTIYKAGKATK